MIFGLVNHYGPGAERNVWGETYRYQPRDWMVTFPPGGLMVLSRSLVSVPPMSAYSPEENAFEIVFPSWGWGGKLHLDRLHPDPAAELTRIFVKGWRRYWSR